MTSPDADHDEQEEARERLRHARKRLTRKASRWKDANLVKLSPDEWDAVLRLPHYPIHDLYRPQAGWPEGSREVLHVAYDLYRGRVFLVDSAGRNYARYIGCIMLDPGPVAEGA